MIARNFRERIAQLIGVLRQDTGSGGGLKNAGNLHIAERVRFHLDLGYPEIGARVVADLVIGKTREISTQFIDDGRAPVTDVAEGDGRISRLEKDVRRWADRTRRNRIQMR